MAFQITCITKDERQNPYERITNIAGAGFYVTQEEAIRNIETKAARYYVRANGNSAWVVVATSRFGNKYLKTQNDGDEPNNLLSLPECTRSWG